MRSGPKNDFSLAVASAMEGTGKQAKRAGGAGGVGGGNAAAEVGFYVPSESVREVAIYPRDLEIVAAMATRMLGISESEERGTKL